jgi:predicted neuraminidase
MPRASAGSDWAAPQKVVERSRATTELRRHIKKLGNAIVYRHPDGRLWLFFVSVSIGGWATSAVNLIESLDDGQSWSPARRLVTTPFLNVSTLVRSSVVPLAMAASACRSITSSSASSPSCFASRPTADPLEDAPVERSARAAAGNCRRRRTASVALMRNGGSSRGGYCAPHPDSGRTWSTPLAIAAPNPDAAIDVIEFGGGSLLAVMNDADDSRERLILATSENWALTGSSSRCSTSVAQGACASTPIPG